MSEKLVTREHIIKSLRYTRHLYYDLPEDVVKGLESLFFVKDSDDIRLKRDRAEVWFNETLQQIDLEGTGVLPVKEAQ